MPFEMPENPARRIAVIGGGISGLAAAFLLAQHHRITLFESESRLGGHARTVLAGRHGDTPVDTGFIVFNYSNYPNLTAMFARLDVPVAPSNMSFGASFDAGRFEYSLSGIDEIFATRRNLADPRYWRMMRDIVHFNKHGLAMAQADATLTTGGLLARLGTGDWFRDRYLLPFSGAIWSTPTRRILDFPAQALMGFFRNHALLGYEGQHQWYTVRGGSVEYVRRLSAHLEHVGVRLRTGTPVQSVTRGPLGVQVKAYGMQPEEFDEIIFATHSDVTLRLLADAAPRETAALGAVRYQRNDAILHCDPAVMPRRRKCWSSWVYTERGPADRERISLSYWMNSLQPIAQDDPMFVTLNANLPLREECIYDSYSFDHPVYDAGALRAQADIRAFNGTNRTWFCGAWMRNGFHEDGFASAVDVAQAMTSPARQVVAA
ncbi:NAD(P)/FAD-dependent oxidoreductase [Roseinatronobacter alkalisoli]|uniref:FAD-dependent oxidoreductase n=1 Tax=Roseinatronobacter alkalisoli TaxID=3028235 RepID=A0ABT5T9I9_9RHOB|nr:FAD-dependent oxidoreductase [Roseinatronobacter sp. HJB301]MDD7971390.1 FAD-dependent oxidoreductase [Roseinatronobacter sp. HJB301]